MTITLLEDISTGQGLVAVANATEAHLDQVLKIDDELVVIRNRPRAGGDLILGRGVLGSERATHLADAVMTPHVEEPATLSDPVNSWAPGVDVAVGYRIVATLRGESEIFEVTTSGTTNADPDQGPSAPNATTNYWDFFGGHTTDGSAAWKHVGRVGWAPLSGRLPQGWRIDPNNGSLWIASTSPAVEGGDGQFLRWSRTKDDGSIEDIYTVNTDGDADYFILESGSSVFWHGAASAGVLFRIRGSGDDVSVVGPLLPGIAGDLFSGSKNDRKIGFFGTSVVQQGMDRPDGDAGALWDVLRAYGLVTPLIPTNIVPPGSTSTGSQVQHVFSVGQWDASPMEMTFTYQWQVSDDGPLVWNDHAGATAVSWDYSSAGVDNGTHKRIRCMVTATNTSGSSSAPSDLIQLT